MVERGIERKMMVARGGALEVEGMVVLRCSGAFMVVLVSPFGAADGGCVGWRSRLGVEDMASWCCCLVARFGWRLRER